MQLISGRAIMLEHDAAFAPRCHQLEQGSTSAARPPLPRIALLRLLVASSGALALARSRSKRRAMPEAASQSLLQASSAQPSGASSKGLTCACNFSCTWRQRATRRIFLRCCGDARWQASARKKMCSGWMHQKCLGAKLPKAWSCAACSARFLQGSDLE